VVVVVLTLEVVVELADILLEQPQLFQELLILLPSVPVVLQWAETPV
jgi:hypothetical protein